MKKILTLIALGFTLNAYSQNGIYIVTEKFDGMFSAPTYDSVFVTNPLGVTTFQVIPHIHLNLKNHNTSLNIIFNNITQLGYKMVENGPMQLGFNTPAYYTHTWYFCQPWTSAGLEPAGANNSQLKIIEVFPNPCDQFMNIKLSQKMKKASLVIINAEGYIMQKSEIYDDEIITLNVSKYTPGIYFVRLVDDRFYTDAVKVVIQ